MRLIIAAICSLALSITGILGVNQLTSNNDDNINSKYDIQDAQQDTIDEKVQDTEDTVSKADKDNTIAQADEDMAEEAAPKADIQGNDSYDKTAPKADESKTYKTADKSIADNNTKGNNTADINNTVTADNKTNSTANNKANNVINSKPKDNNISANTGNTVQNNSSNNYSTESLLKELTKNGRNGQVYVYKSDLSDCNSYADVADKLQKNGYYNLDADDLKNIGSLEDIVKLFGNNTGNRNQTQTPVPAKPSNPTPVKPSEPTTKPSAPAPTTKPSEGNNGTATGSYANQVLQLVNAERAKAGLSSLTTNSTLSAAADKRAKETVQSFSHTRPNGTKFSTVLQEYGISYRTAGENIAYGQRSPQEVVTGWMNSPGHRANILNGSFSKIGIGVYQSNGVIYWSQLFTG